MNKCSLLENLKMQGFREEIINAFRLVERSKFVPFQYADLSYADRALPIGYGQTISQPSTIAFMLDLLELNKKSKVLEVGSGSGYVLALLADIVSDGHVTGTERIEELVADSREKLSGQKTVSIEHTPTGLGLPGKAPFDRILVSASSKVLSPELLDQLSDGGVMVEPVGNSIIKAVKKNNKISTEEYPGFVFVKLYE